MRRRERARSLRRRRRGEREEDRQDDGYADSTTSDGLASGELEAVLALDSVAFVSTPRLREICFVEFLCSSSHLCA